MFRDLLLATCVAVSVCLPAKAQSLSKDDQETLDGADETALSYARCAGYWEWFSEFLRRSGKPAAADYINTFSNGAYSSALWLLASKNALENPHGEPRMYGSFAGLIDGPKEVERMRMTALEELDDTDAIEKQHVNCEAHMEGSEEVINLIRQERAGT